MTIIYQSSQRYERDYVFSISYNYFVFLTYVYTTITNCTTSICKLFFFTCIHSFIHTSPFIPLFISSILFIHSFHSFIAIIHPIHPSHPPIYMYSFLHLYIHPSIRPLINYYCSSFFQLMYGHHLQYQHILSLVKLLKVY